MVFVLKRVIGNCKAIKFILLLSIVFMGGCKVNNIKTHEVGDIISGVYVFESELKTFKISIAFLENNKFSLEQSSGLSHRYSNGNYRIEGDVIILNSIYKGGFRLPSVAWISLENENIERIGNKLKYKGKILEKLKYNKFENSMLYKMPLLLPFASFNSL